MSTKRAPETWSWVIVIALFVLASALLVTYSSYQTRRLVARYQQLQTTNNLMQVEWGRLLLEQSTWGSFNRVEQLAGNQLNMRVPAPNEIIMVKP